MAPPRSDQAYPYPGLHQVKDGALQQSLRLLWDRVHALENITGARTIAATPARATRGTLSPDEKPTALLGSEDAGFVFYSTDFNRNYRWTGSVWEDAPGSDPRGFIITFSPTPTTTPIGYAPANGAVVVRSTPTGGVETYRTPTSAGNYVRL